MNRRHWLRGTAPLAASLALGAFATAASAQGYPDRPIRMIVPAPPGGTIDIVARSLTEAMQASLGQPLVVDNKAGAAGMIGVSELLKAPRDGYTVIVHISGAVSEIPLIIKMPFDPFKDLKPLIELSRSGLVFVAGPQVAASSVPELVAQMKAAGKGSYASYSPGTMSHTLGVEFNRATGLDLAHVGYKGSPPALQDLMGGAVQVMFDGPATSMPLIQSGRIKPLAVTTSKRMQALPNVPTFAELGYQNLTQTGWVGLWVTPDTPLAVQARLREAAAKAIQQPAVRERFATLGMEVGTMTDPDAMAKDLRAAYDRQAALLKSIDFKSE